MSRVPVAVGMVGRSSRRRAGIGDEESKDAPPGRPGPDLPFLLVAQSDRHKLVQGCAGLVQDPEGPEAGPDQIGGLLNQVAKQFGRSTSASIIRMAATNR